MSSATPNPNIPATSASVDPHKPPTDDESIYYEGSPLLGGKAEQVLLLALLGTAFLIGPILLKIFNGKWPQHWLIIAMEVIGVILWLIPVFITRAIRYRITNYRIDYERGVFTTDITTLELWHVEDLAFHQSILDRILGIGTINVISHDDNMPDLRMRGLPDARKLFEELKQRIIAVKRQSGVLKLDTGT